MFLKFHKPTKDYSLADKKMKLPCCSSDEFCLTNHMKTHLLFLLFAMAFDSNFSFIKLHLIVDLQYFGPN